MKSSSDRFCQAGKRRMAFLFSVLPVLLVCSIAYSQKDFKPAVGLTFVQSSVVIYEDPNFEGRSKSLSIGDSRLSDFSGMASSIKVPAGFVAMLYEHVDEGGGYGISVDLLEDCPDLSKYNFDDKVSYISVFNASSFVEARQHGGGLPVKTPVTWARNSIQNGQFVAGHWERPRAGGNPANTVAVVSPPLPPHAPTGPTTIQVSDAQSTITSLGVEPPENELLWDHAETDQMGVIGSDYRGVEEIGSAAFERASHNIAIPDNINFWYPQKQPRDHRSIVYFKRTLSGSVSGNVRGDRASQPHIANVNGTYEDHDVNLDIRPFSKYMYLITEGHKPELSRQQSAELRGESIVDLEGKEDPCTNPFLIVEAEIDAHTAAKNKLTNFLMNRIGKSVCVYGPWIYDKGHCYHPEIHPAEEIWWSESVGHNRQYNMNLFCDASKRFWWRHQMDDGTKLKPWGAPPITGTFAIAFEVELGKPGKQFNISNIDDYNVAVNPNTDKTYTLVYHAPGAVAERSGGDVLVSFVPHNDAFKVSFEKVGLKPGTTSIVHGFLVIETTVGTVTQIDTKNFPPGADPDKINQDDEEKAFKKVEGHYMFSVLQTDIIQAERR